MYGSEVLFIDKKILDFETVHLSFLKNMLGVKQQTTSVTIYGGYRKVFSLFKTTNSSFEILNSLDLVA